ncbi:hypothetical protein [Bradyrhizobium liaoningense]|uniref:pPIWI-associating nuclease domain-containing protein n=1 Tax=Bradyrhizobium liaoningense TaxID=43992 RepID=UPI001BA636C0|nr:hypothetical protein [Bradyrhizobium liaoningense]
MQRGAVQTTGASSIKESFPFTCRTAASTTEPLKLLSDQTEMKVDTSSWHGED